MRSRNSRRTRSKDLGTLARSDPAFGAQDARDLHGSVRNAAASRRRTSSSATRASRRIFQYKIDNNLHAQTELYPAMPRSQAEIADSTFRLAQLRSFGRLTLATLSAEIDRAATSTRPRGRSRALLHDDDAERRLPARPARTRSASRPAARRPTARRSGRCSSRSTCIYEETAKQYDKYVAFVRQKAPGVTELATPRPLPVREFQRRLQGHEAIVATLVTPLDLYVWAITGSERHTHPARRSREREIADKVQRLRAGLATRPRHLPAFDAAVAHELYRLIFEPSAAALHGVTQRHLVRPRPARARCRPRCWSSAPPRRRSSHARRSSPRRSSWSTVMPLPRSRICRCSPGTATGQHALIPQPRFLGVGAPMLSSEELAGTSRARSYELAGADVTGLANGGSRAAAEARGIGRRDEGSRR